MLGRQSKSQDVAMLEKFLLAFDPDASTSAQTLVQRKRQASMKLHSHHLYIITAQQLLSDYLSSIETPDFFRAAGYLRKSLAAVTSLLPPNHPEIASCCLRLVACLDGCVSGSRTLPSKTAQAMRKERSELQAKAHQIRLISLGSAHVLTVESNR